MGRKIGDHPRREPVKQRLSHFRAERRKEPEINCHRAIAGMRALALTALCGLICPLSVEAQTGVSEDRVSLPEGPGSLEGMGENLHVSGNMGQMTFALPIDVPRGHMGMAPPLSLQYSSGNGSGSVGMGWSLDPPYIERTTYRGIPHYDALDRFSADGGTHLTRIPGTSPPVYRQRFEGAFIRYTWLDVGDGAEGYWRAEYPDGRVGTFGADADGNLIDTARVGGAQGTFRYNLVEMRDPFGHVTRYEYVKPDGVTYVSHIGWNHPTPEAQALAAADFTYEARLDHRSDAKPGFDMRITRRLRDIDVSYDGEAIRSYRLTYEEPEASGMFSRLSLVEQFGADGGRFPVVFDFAYSRTLGTICPDDDPTCREPFLFEMGSLGVDLGAGRATLIDINGDALPDIVDTTDRSSNPDSPSFHRFFMNTLIIEDDGEGNETRRQFFPPFEDTQVSTTGRSGGFTLGSGPVQVLDLNADGFADMINARTGDVLLNTGSGDWTAASSLGAGNGLPDLSEQVGDDGELRTMRFLDTDNDKHIDLMRSQEDATTVFRNDAGEGFDEAEADAIGWGFETHNLELNDVNGDGLLDPVILRPGGISFRLNLGRGHWGEQVDIDDLPVTSADITGRRVQLEDLNGDALADLVIVRSGEIEYALNRNARSFLAVQTLSRAGELGLPERDENTTVLFADMNGNGSADIVWVQNPDGEVKVLELFPVRPNLLTRVQNGLGMVQTVSYGTSVEHLARGGGEWDYRLPHAMMVVDETVISDTLTGVSEITRFTYDNGFYDGIEKQFRGYETVRRSLQGEEVDGVVLQEAGETVNVFDVGAGEVYMHGKLLNTSVSSGGRDLRETAYSFSLDRGDCPLEGIPAADAFDGSDDPVESIFGAFPVQWACATGHDEILKEGAEADEWVTRSERHAYDGYGNDIRHARLGVTAVGGESCGAACEGDERVVESEFVSPDDTNGRWMVHKPWRVRESGEDAELESEIITYYDGDAFVGLAAGRLTDGRVSRVTHRVTTDGGVVDAHRNRHDTHGNVIETIDPNGDPDAPGHRRLTSYSNDGLFIVRVDIDVPLPEGAGGDDYYLRREFEWDRGFGRTIEATDWVRVEGDEVVTPINTTFFAYDEFGRNTAISRPGDTPAAPSEEFTYELANPVSRVILRRRSQMGAAGADMEAVRCFDGRGRLVQERTRLAEDDYQVTGFRIRSPRGADRTVYQPYRADSNGCDAAPPAGTLFVQTTFDSLFRVRQVIQADEAIYGTASVRETVYQPLSRRVYDEEDSDDDSAYADTPTVHRFDGLDRLVGIDRSLAPGVVETTSFEYDGLGHLLSVIDAEGNRKAQTFDVLGRVLTIDDPNAGQTELSYDAAGHVIERRDARGVVVHTSYDAANRLLARWDGDDRDGTLTEWLWDVALDCDPSVCSNASNRLAGVTFALGDGVAGDRFGYDNRGRRIVEARTLDDVTFSSEYAYDNVNRLVESTYPDGQVVAREYDDARRLTAVTGVVDAITYDDRGQMAGFDLANGIETVRGYDERMRLVGTAAVLGDATLDGYALSRDRVGNVEALTVSGTDAAYTGDWSHDFDAWYRVTETSISIDDGGSEVISNTFDAIDNVTSQLSDAGGSSGANVGDYTYGSDQPNAVVEAGDIQVEYDAAGYMVERGDWTFTWDHRGRLTGAELGEKSVSWAYGGDERRVRRTMGASTTYYVAPDFEVRDGISSLYVRLGRDRVARLQSDALAAVVIVDADDDGTITLGDAWLHTADGNEGGGAVASSLRRLLMEEQGEQMFFSHDHLGSVTVAYSGEGEVLGRQQFYGTGATRLSDYRGLDEYGFTGQLHGDPTGLIHYRFRSLDSATGRWASVDPLFLTSTMRNVQRVGESTSAYAYVANNWATVWDPLGLCGKGKKVQSPKQTKRRSFEDPMNRIAERNALGGMSSGDSRRSTENFLTRMANSSLFKKGVDLTLEAISPDLQAVREVIGHGRGQTQFVREARKKLSGDGFSQSHINIMMEAVDNQFGFMPAHLRSANEL